MADTIKKWVKFTCLSVSRVSRHGNFYRGQVIIVSDDDPRIPWFRSGGFKEEPLPAEIMRDRATRADSGEPEKPSGEKTPVAELVGVAAITKKMLRSAGLMTVGHIIGRTDDELLAMEGIAEKSLEKIKAACDKIMKASKKNAGDEGSGGSDNTDAGTGDSGSEDETSEDEQD